MELKLKITTAPGLEGLLSEELNGLGLCPCEKNFGAVMVNADWRQAANILLWSRIGSRVLLELSEFSARTEAMLYSHVRRVDWPSWISVDQTFSVRVSGDFSATAMARTFAPLKIKDAVCDEFRKRVGSRPDVNREDPDLPIYAFFNRGRCQLSIDLAGKPLHRRGYRLETAAAPIKEHRAAALLRFVGYDGSRPFVDPFCGSGTIVIEAALIALGKPPGLLRDPETLAACKVSSEGRMAVMSAWEQARNIGLKSPIHPVKGMDSDPECVARSMENARRAGLEKAVSFEIGDARHLMAPDSDIVCNPPYGERIGDMHEAIQTLSGFTTQVKTHCPGSRLGLVLPHGPMTKKVGLKADRKLVVESAPLELRFLKYSIFGKAFPTNPSGSR